MLKRVGENRHPCRTNCCSEPVSYDAVEEDCTSGLVIKVFVDSGKVGADVVEVLLVLEMFLTEDS